MRMSKNRASVTEYTTYFTPESTANGESDRTEVTAEKVYDNLKDFAEHLMDAIRTEWLFETGHDSMHGEMNYSDYIAGEMAESSVHWTLGANIDTDLNRAALKIYITRAMRRKKVNEMLIKAFNDSFRLRA